MLGHPPSPLASPFSHGGSHGVAGSSCYWSLSVLKQPSPTHRLSAEVLAPDPECPALRKGAGQDLPSPCPPPHTAIQVPQEVPALLLPSQVSQGSGGSALRSPGRACSLIQGTSEPANEAPPRAAGE